MRRFLLLHGLDNRRPVDHWQWLAEQLRRRGEQVLYPQLPDPDRPDLRRWLASLAAEYAQLGDGERIVVCHSLACALWYQAAAATAFLDPPAERLLLVAPPGPSVLARPVTRAFDPGVWDPERLSTSCRARIRLVGSDADPHCLEGPTADVYGPLLRVDAETIRGAGHLTPADGYGPWPEVLRWCLEGEAEFGASLARSPGRSSSASCGQRGSRT